MSEDGTLTGPLPKRQKNPVHVIEHLQKVFPTKYLAELTDEECEHIRMHFFDKPSDDLLNRQIILLRRGGVKINYICDNYFYELMADCRRKDQKWSIRQFLDCNDLIRYAVAKTSTFPNIYHPSFGIMKNIRILFRLSPSSAAAKIGNFPYKTAKQVVETYNLNGKVYDFSCGWSVRLSACLSQDLDYCGTDPNARLVTELKNLTQKFRGLTECSSIVDIRCQGSEVFVPEWENKIGLAFSYPPYYDLEEYSLSDSDGQSTAKNKCYEDWLTNYMEVTLRNIFRYLVEGGKLLLNIKNVGKFMLFDDCQNLAKSCGFTFNELASFSPGINGVNRPCGKDNTEKIMVFQRGVLPLGQEQRGILRYFQNK